MSSRERRPEGPSATHRLTLDEPSRGRRERPNPPITRTIHNANSKRVTIFASTVIALRDGCGKGDGRDGSAGRSPDRTLLTCRTDRAGSRFASARHPDRGLAVRRCGTCPLWMGTAPSPSDGRGRSLRIHPEGRRPGLCAADPELIPSGEGKCEYDVYGTSTAGAVSLTRNLDAKSTRDPLAGRFAPAQALSASQIGYLREIVGIWPLPLDFAPLGPMQVRTYRTKGKPYDIDISRLPDGERFAEISRKVPLTDFTRAKEVMEADLSRAGRRDVCRSVSQAGKKLRSLLRQR